MHTMTDEMLEQIKGASYEEGMRDALNYLSQLFEGVEETDLWSDYIDRNQVTIKGEGE